MKISLFMAILLMTGLASAQTNQNAVAVVGDIYGVHVTSYNYQESQDYYGNNHDDSFETWQNGGGGSASFNFWNETSNNGTWPETIVWPASFWPNPLAAGYLWAYFNNQYYQTNYAWSYSPGGGNSGAHIIVSATSPSTGSSFTENFLTGMTLSTGGAAGSTETNLFEITVTAQTRISPVPPNPDQVPWYPDSSPIAVPYDQIEVGLFGKLDNDGNAYALLPDNKDVDATPNIKGNDDNFYQVTPGKYKLTTWTHSPALTNTNRSRTTIGVGEEVDLRGMPGKTTWTASAGGLSATNGGSVTFTAPSNAPPSGLTTTVIATVGRASWAIPFKVFPPTGIDHAVIVNEYTNTYPLGYSGSGMDVDVYVAPTSVSFYRVSIMEVPGPASNIAGFYTNGAPAHTIARGAGHWTPLGIDNKFTDTAARLPPGRLPPFIPGGFDWVIPSDWQITGSSVTNAFTQWTQSIRMLNSSGDFSISKFGQTVTRTTNNVVTP